MRGGGGPMSAGAGHSGHAVSRHRSGQLGRSCLAFEYTAPSSARTQETGVAGCVVTHDRTPVFGQSLPPSPTLRSCAMDPPFHERVSRDSERVVRRRCRADPPKYAPGCAGGVTECCDFTTLPRSGAVGESGHAYCPRRVHARDTKTFVARPTRWEDFGEGGPWPQPTCGGAIFPAFEGLNLGIAHFIDARPVSRSRDPAACLGLRHAWRQGGGRGVRAHGRGPDRASCATPRSMPSSSNCTEPGKQGEDDG